VADALPAAVRTVPDAVAWWATRTPHAPALLPADGSIPISYRDLQARVLTLAGRLTVEGVARGDILAFPADGTVAAIVTFIAAMRVGVALPLAPGIAGRELDGILRQLRPALAIAWDEESPLIAAAHRNDLRLFDLTLLRLPESENGSVSAAADGPDDAQPCDAGNARRRDAILLAMTESPVEDELALIMHSSGTTGRARGIPRTHGNVFAACAAYLRWLGREAFARFLVTTPLSFGMGVNGFLAALTAGGSAALIHDREPSALLRAIVCCRPTWIYAVPTILEAIVATPDGEGALRAATWHGVSSAGMAPSPALARRVELAFGTPLVEGYGCGEAGLIAGMRLGETGSPGVFPVTLAAGLAIVDADCEPTAPGVPGEIAVWGPQVAADYLADPEASATSWLPGGRFRTGDLGLIDDTGCLRLTARLKEIINRGGEKLAPVAIDEALLAHPAVAEAAAFSLPVGRLGEDVAAAVVLKPGATVTARELRREVTRRLPLTNVPRRIWFVASLPRTESGKVRRGELSRRFAAACDEAET
jgi:acyl-coenzyme A synthetase/AMP-(fatty) acid ligase